MTAERAHNIVGFWRVGLATADLDNLKFFAAFLTFLSSHTFLTTVDNPKIIACSDESHPYGCRHVRKKEVCDQSCCAGRNALNHSFGTARHEHLLGSDMGGAGLGLKA